MSKWLMQCGKKRRYRTEGYARRIADHAERKRGAKLRVYPCAMCAGWHITHLPERGAA